MECAGRNHHEFDGLPFLALSDLPMSNSSTHDDGQRRCMLVECYRRLTTSIPDVHDTQSSRTDVVARR